MNDERTMPVIWWDEERPTINGRNRTDRLPLAVRLYELEPALIAAGISFETIRSLLNQIAALEEFDFAKGHRM